MRTGISSVTVRIRSAVVCRKKAVELSVARIGFSVISTLDIQVSCSFRDGESTSMSKTLTGYLLTALADFGLSRG